MNQILNSLLDRVDDYRVNEFAIYRHTVYLDSVNVGLASTANANPCVDIPDGGRLHELTTKQLARRIHSSKIIEAAIGLAAINASFDHSRLDSQLISVNAVDILLEKGRGKNVSIIGHFPFINRLIKNKVCNNIWVFELNPKSPDDLAPDLMPEFIPQSDVVLMSATTLINHTLDEIIGLCENSYNIILGPSTPLTLSMFDFGINAVCGAIVRDKEKAKLSFAQGARYRDADGLEFVCLRD